MASTPVLYFAADHAGVVLKDALRAAFEKRFPDTRAVDLGTQGPESVHYPDFAFLAADKVAKGGGRAVLVCGSGIGMAIAANKVRGIRAAVVWDATSGRLSREHNDANVLCLGQRLVGPAAAEDALFAWWTAAFAEGRHRERLDRIHRREEAP
jgi:ribose 5-phosphate isomerase B